MYGFYYSFAHASFKHSLNFSFELLFAKIIFYLKVSILNFSALAYRYF